MGMNTVEVDPQALDSEVDRILSDVPPDAAPANSPALAGEELPAAELTIEQIQEIAKGYEGGAYLVISKAADMIVPGWEITSDERKQLSISVALALAAWFPDFALPPKYVALMGVAGGLYAIVDSRRDPDTGKLKPRRTNVPEKTASGSNAGAGASLSTAQA